MKDQLHIASQYLAAANISFLEKKADDSHTNMGFDIDTKYMETHDLSSSGDKISLNYKDFSLEWISQNGTAILPLHEKTHEEVLKWLKERSQTRLNKEYTYKLHYDLPYIVEDNYQFKLTDATELRHLCGLRILAQQTIEAVVTENNLDSSTRVWPHHFDTGAYAALSEDSDISIGIGMAIPDTVCDQHYFYISGYKGEDTITPSSPEKLSIGKWVDQDFKGAILPTAHITKLEAVQFFREAIDQLKK